MEDGRIHVRRSYDKLELTAEDVFDAISVDLSQEERQKLLCRLCNEYFSKQTDKKLKKNDAETVEILKALHEFEERFNKRIDEFYGGLGSRLDQFGKTLEKEFKKTNEALNQTDFNSPRRTQ